MRQFHVTLIFITVYRGIFACAPGEGPKPFQDITPSFPTATRFLRTHGSIQEFVPVPFHDDVFYRNYAGKIHSLNLQGSFTYSELPLAPVIDSMGKWLMTSNAHWGFNILSLRWGYFLGGARELKPIFWNKGELYATSEEVDEKGSQTIRFYVWEDAGEFKEICTPLEAPAGQHFQFAHGHKFPHIYFFRNEISDDPRLSIHAMKVGARLAGMCDFFGLKSYSRAIAAPAKQVHVFPKKSLLHSDFAMILDHPEKNFLWDTPSWCEYFDVGGRKLVVPSHNASMMLGWSSDGMRLFFPNEGESAEVGERVSHHNSIALLRQRDVALTQGGKKILLAPKLSYDQKRWLVEMTLPVR